MIALQKNTKMVLNWWTTTVCSQNLKKQLKGKRLLTNDEVTCAIEEWFADIIFLKDMKLLIELSAKCVTLKGIMIMYGRLNTCEYSLVFPA